MSDDNVIPFRKRPPSRSELEIFRQMTKNWHPDMKRQMFPEHVKAEEQSNDSQTSVRK